MIQFRLFLFFGALLIHPYHLVASFYDEHPCSLIKLLQTEPNLDQAMLIFADHLERNGRQEHADWVRLALTVDRLKIRAPNRKDLIALYERKQEEMLWRHTVVGEIDEFAEKFFKPLKFQNPYDWDLSHNFLRFELSPENPAVFTMGSDMIESNPLHKVTLTESFEISRFLATQLEVTLVTGAAPYHFRGRATMLVNGLAIDPFRPAESVSWQDIEVKFFRRLNEMEQAKPRGQPKYRYFLPTEAQWEYAARAGSSTDYFFGQDPSVLPLYAWFYRNGKGPSRTMPVGQLRANPNGMYDTSGNVWELVADANSKLSSEAMVDPKVEGHRWSQRICRGGGYGNHEWKCSSLGRDNVKPNDRNNGAGFRVARTLLNP